MLNITTPATPYDPTLSGRLSAIQQRLVYISVNTNKYERALGEYTTPMPDCAPGSESDENESKPTVFDMIRSIEGLLNDIENTQANLNNIIQ